MAMRVEGSKPGKRGRYLIRDVESYRRTMATMDPGSDVGAIL